MNVYKFKPVKNEIPSALLWILHDWNGDVFQLGDVHVK